jgi:predicted phosphodiesterase
MTTTFKKIAVLSDIHGNLPALKAALAQIADMKADSIIILDLVTDFYQYTNEVISLVRDTTPYVLRGNREGYIIHKSEHPDDKTWENYK